MSDVKALVEGDAFRLAQRKGDGVRGSPGCCSSGDLRVGEQQRVSVVGYDFAGWARLTVRGNVWMLEVSCKDCRQAYDRASDGCPAGAGQANSARA